MRLKQPEKSIRSPLDAREVLQERIYKAETEMREWLEGKFSHWNKYAVMQDGTTATQIALALACTQADMLEVTTRAAMIQAWAALL